MFLWTVQYSPLRLWLGALGNNRGWFSFGYIVIILLFLSNRYFVTIKLNEFAPLNHNKFINRFALTKLIRLRYN